MRTVHPIEVESYEILRSRADPSTLPPLTRAVVERVIHASADLDYLPTTWSATRRLRDGAEALALGVPVRLRRRHGRGRHHRRRGPYLAGARRRGARVRPHESPPASGSRWRRSARAPCGSSACPDRTVRAADARDARLRPSSSGCRSASSGPPSPRRRCARRDFRRSATSARRAARRSLPPPLNALLYQEVDL